VSDTLPPEPSPAPEAAPATVFRVMNAESVTFDLGDPSPMMHLIEDAEPYRSLSVPIALPEAVALHQALERVAGRRPGTHELASEILGRLRADVVAARIVRFVDGVFYAELDLMGPAGREVLDCRTSDAVILALRQRVRAPILCAEQVLSSAAN
jgi:bifunctional DNase/RNase